MTSDDDRPATHECTVVALGGDVLLAQHDVAGREWSGVGPRGRARGDVAGVLRACASDPAPDWAQAVADAVAREIAYGGGQRRSGLLVRRGTTERRYHVTRSVNRESIRRHGLDPRRMTSPGIAGSLTPEWAGVFVDTEGKTSFFRGFTDDETDVWAVDVRGLWLEGAPASSGGFDDTWAIVPGTVPTDRLELVVAGGAPGR